MLPSRLNAPRLPSTISSILALALVGALFALHVSLALQQPYFNQFSNVEDWAYTNIAARNYLHFGLLNTLGLQDYAASLFPLDHPFVYNHMPPGPDLLTAFFLVLTGGDHHWTRILFGALVLPGLYYYVRFVTLICAPRGIPGAAMALLIAGPYVIMNHLQAEVHSAFLFLSFAPMCWVIEANKHGGKFRFPAAVALTFLLSIYIQYILLAATLFAWIFLYLLRIVPITRRQILIIVGAIVAGITAHLIQNLLYLGPSIFFKELMYTIGNRTIGVPTQEELRDFYVSVGLVHHGSQRANLEFLAFTLIGNLKFKLALLIAPMLGLWMLGSVLQHFLSRRVPEIWNRFRISSGVGDDGQALFFLRLFAWPLLTVISVILLFPAHTQEVNLSSYGGINLLLFAVPTVAIIGQGLILARPMIDCWSREGVLEWVDKNKNVIVAVVIWLLVALLVIVVIGFAIFFPHTLVDQSWGQQGRRVAQGVLLLSQRALSLNSPLWVATWVVGFGLILAANFWRYRSLASVANEGDGNETSMPDQLTISGNQGRKIGKVIAVHLILLGSAIRAFLILVALMAVFSAVARATLEVKQILSRATEPNELAPLVSLQAYKGRLFMTNINVPSIGFFTESPGYGVCGRDSIGVDGILAVKECKIQQMRRNEYWLTQRPEHFIYFKKGRVFPGFATCWPRDAYLGILRGGAGCNEELGERLAAHFKISASNDLYDVYDLNPEPARSTSRR